MLNKYIHTIYNRYTIRDDPYRTSRKNSLELIELSSINKVSLELITKTKHTQHTNTAQKTTHHFIHIIIKPKYLTYI